MSVSIRNSIVIARPCAEVYAYVTQPWRWCEWHEGSKHAQQPANGELIVGDEFVEQIELRPFAPLPIRLRRQTRYRVIHAEVARSWAVQGLLRDGWLKIFYDLEEVPSGTRFTRTLEFGLSGVTRMLGLFLRRHAIAQSAIAINNLRARLEAS